MKVKIIDDFKNVVNGRVYHLKAGEERELPEGARWVEIGKAKPLKKKRETATKGRKSKK